MGIHLSPFQHKHLTRLTSLDGRGLRDLHHISSTSSMTLVDQSFC